MNLLRCAAIALVGWAVIISVEWAHAGSERVAFPANYKSGLLYNEVDREDIQEVHRAYTSREAIEAAKAGKPLPMGTVITTVNYKALLDPQGNPIRDAKGNLLAGELLRFGVMEKRSGWGAEYPDNLRNGEWEFAAFTADGKSNAQVDTKACMVCHKPHGHQLDYVKTYFAMAGKRVETNPVPVPTGAVVATVVRFAVHPARLTVQAGTPVTWINIDDPPHQFLVEGAGLKTDYLLKGQTGTVVLKEPGIYHYRDTFYPDDESLKGVLEVRK
ncbi:MAG: cytochrome P460 family protein [Planctomycetaceae bacterium]|jgi:plastocyanin|nr:cytochrome P460 family protein [Planctomycetaceae bacterium]